MAAESGRDTAEGKQLLELISAGKIVPGSLMLQLMAKAVRETAGPHVLLDFPRSAQNLKQLEAVVGAVACVLHASGEKEDSATSATLKQLEKSGRSVVALGSSDRVSEAEAACLAAGIEVGTAAPPVAAAPAPAEASAPAAASSTVQIDSAGGDHHVIVTAAKAKTSKHKVDISHNKGDGKYSVKINIPYKAVIKFWSSSQTSTWTGLEILA